MTEALIPLFAVGAFGAFFFSQSGMVKHWRREKGKGYQMKLAFNALGATITAIALVIIVVAKFIHGAWMTIVFIPVLTMLLFSIKRHYKKVSREIEQPLELEAMELHPPVVLVPIFHGWDASPKRPCGMRYYCRMMLLRFK